jgi:hypothetical protein
MGIETEKKIGKRGIISYLFEFTIIISFYYSKYHNNK